MKPIVALVGLVFSVQAPAYAAGPQTYVVPACSSAQGGKSSLSGWITESKESVDDCAGGGGFGGSPGDDGLYWSYTAPSNTQISAVRVWRAGATNEQSAYSFDAQGIDQSEYVTLDADSGLHGVLTGREFDGLHAGSLDFGMRCYVSPCAPADNWVRFTRIEMVMRDVVNPRVTALDATAPVDGAVTVRASFADIGGGVRDIALLVDGVMFYRPGPKCVEPYSSAVPCPLDGTVEMPLDMRTMAGGRHTVSVEVTDVAGNHSVSKPYDISMPAPPLAAPSEPAMTMTPEWRTITAKHDEQPVIRARLRDAAGTPLVGVKVGVAVRPVALGAPFVLDTPVFSDAQGWVTVRLPKGTSREVRLTHGAQTALVSVVVKAPLRFASSPATTRNGHTIRLHGSVAGTEASTEVELQARSGTKWIPFKTVKLRNGRFSAQYRFLRTFQTTRYRFRAVIHGDARFPYAAATSRVAKVLVRP